MASSSMVAENWGHVDSHDCSENSELSPGNQNILMSLLDETPIDDCDDDERLTKVMQSLQAELECPNHHVSWESDDLDRQSSVDELHGQECSSEVDLHWMDVDTAPSGDVANWYVDHQNGQGVIDGGMNYDQFGWIKNSFAPIETDQDYGPLWHVTNDNFL